jgi:hypothetical protein
MARLFRFAIMGWSSGIGCIQREPAKMALQLQLQLQLVLAFAVAVAFQSPVERAVTAMSGAGKGAASV